MSARRLVLNRISTSVLRAAFLPVAAMLAVAQSSAQTQSTYSEYSAKFICGVPSPSDVAGEKIEAGEYSTSINIHNPNLFSSDKPIAFLKKAVIAHTEGTPFTPPSSFRQDTLPNDYSESVTCSVIRGLLGTSAPAAPKFIEGFVVIIVPPAGNPNELDVVGVYTSSNNPPLTLQVLPIAARIIAPPTSAAALEGKID